MEKLVKSISFMAFMLVAFVAVVFTSCTADDLDDTGRRSTSYAKSTENSNLTVDDYRRVATLNVTVTKTDAQGNTLAPMSGEANAKLSANIEQNPIQTSVMDKEFGMPAIETSNINGGQLVSFVIDINDNNKINGTVTITKTAVYDNEYTLKVNAIEVDKANVTVVDTKTKSSAEKARQLVTVPLNVTVESVGTAETHTGVIPATVTYEQYQLKDDITFDHYEIDKATHTITNGKDDYLVTVASVWSDGSRTTQDYKYATTHYFNTISLDDVYVKAFAYSLSKIEGLSVGTASFVKNSEDGRFAEYQREDLYSALHDYEGNPQIKCVYMAGIPKVVFSIGEGEKKVEYVFDFISASFTETADEILDATSNKTGYDMKVFRNAVTAKYGTQETGVDQQVLEERANLYKQAKAAKGIEVQSKTKTYKAFAIDYTVKYFVLYNDDTKSELMTITTSRPWSLTYDGAWSMTATGTVSQSTTDIVLTKTGENTEDQNVANGKWSCTTTSYTATNNTTVDGQTKKNGWKLSVPTQMILTLYGTEVKFDKDAPEASHSNAKVELTSSSATQEVYTFTETLNAKVGTDTETSLGSGTITKAVEVKVDHWEWANTWQKVEGNLTKAHVEKVYTMTDGSKKTVTRDFSFTRGSQVYTYWETTEADNTESTGAAGWSVVSSEASTSGDWKFNIVKSQLKFGVACKGSNQTDGWNITEANNLSVEIEGDVYTFPEMTYSASANSSQAKTAEDSEKTTYTHTNTPSYTFGGYSMNLAAANGLIFVNKANDPTGHDGFFPKDWGKIKGYNRVAALKANRTEWGVGGAIEFENGTLPFFIEKNGTIVIDKSLYQSGVHGAVGASYDTKGNLQIVTKAENQSTMMVWKNSKTVNYITYTDARQIGFNWGENHVETDKFAGSIQQMDGGKYQVITFNGASYSVTLDSSY
jgi:hypothetical protein